MMMMIMMMTLCLNYSRRVLFSLYLAVTVEFEVG